MKKIDEVYNWIKLHKVMCPGKFEITMFFISLFLGAFAYDINLLFNLEFLYFKAVCGFTFLMVFSYCLAWVLETIILIIYCKVKFHKTPKEFCEVIETARKDASDYENK